MMKRSLREVKLKTIIPLSVSSNGVSSYEIDSPSLPNAVLMTPFTGVPSLKSWAPMTTVSSEDDGTGHVGVLIEPAADEVPISSLLGLVNSLLPDHLDKP